MVNLEMGIDCWMDLLQEVASESFVTHTTKQMPFLCSGTSRFTLQWDNSHEGEEKGDVLV